MQKFKITPVVLAGGKGTRLWPVSREDMPKQFCKLDEGLSLFQNTMIRIRNQDSFTAPIVVTGDGYTETVQLQLRELGITGAVILSEPVGRDTSAAILLAIEVEMQSKGNLMLVMPSDHLIADESAFMQAVEEAADSACHDGLIVTFGIKPTHAETGFGYLRAGEAFFNCSVCRLQDFVEKPDQQAAEALLLERCVFWNAGIFLFDRTIVRNEFSMHAPAVLEAVSNAAAKGAWNGMVFRPEINQFSRCPSISFDYAVMEKTRRAAMIPVAPGWSDLGSWKAIWETSPRNGDDNVVGPNCFTENATQCLVRSDGPVVGVAGLEDVVVVASRDAVLVTSRSNPQDVKKLVETMKAQQIQSAVVHSGEDRPWGRIDTVDQGQAHKVKRIRIEPRQSHSLHYHLHRSERWIVVAGTVIATVDSNVVSLSAGDDIVVPKGAVHRLENRTDQPVEVIEIQTGETLGDGDLVRIEDAYGRKTTDPVQIKSAA